MYLKIIGIVLIMMSASLMGYLFSKDYIERINRLEQIQKMLILLKGEISYSNNSVQEALENISEMIEGKVGEFVTKVQESFKKSEIPLSVAWSLGVDNIFDKKSSLKSEDKNSLKDFGRGLGITDRQTQINNIEKYQSQIQLTIKELKEMKSKFIELVTNQDLPEVRDFLKNVIQEIIIDNETVNVTFNFNTIRNDE